MQIYTHRSCVHGYVRVQVDPRSLHRHRQASSEAVCFPSPLHVDNIAYNGYDVRPALELTRSL